MITAQTSTAGHLIEFFFFPLAVIFTPLLGRAVWRISRKLDQVWVDFVGQPARPGVRRRPGVMERLQILERMGRQVADVHHELTENGGGSVKDQVSHINAIVSPDSSS